MSYVTGHWSFDPILLVVVAIVFAHEVGLARLRRRSSPAHARRRRLHSISFYAGLGVLLLSVESPIDYWARDYFFVHMLEHLLIAFYAPILVVIGAPWIPLLHALPVGARRRAGRSLILGAWSAPLRRVGRFVSNPWFALISFNAVMIGWHIPALFDLSENNQAIHIWLMHGSLLVTGVLFWLQLIPSRPFRPRKSPIWQAGMIISTNIVMFMLAMALSIFSSSSWYSVYGHVSGVTLGPFADQQIGAAILWVCGDFWAVPALIIVVKRAIDQEGSIANVLERLSHRTEAPTVRKVSSTR
jgi:cytochrome c oxidase assembly factor CtaG